MTDNEQQKLQWEVARPFIARLRASVMAIVFGTLLGGGLFLATAWLVVRGGEVVGPHLSLLGNYYPGYTVTWGGSFLGLVYGFLTGAVTGWVVTYLYNLIALRRQPS